MILQHFAISLIYKGGFYNTLFDHPPLEKVCIPTHQNPALKCIYICSIGGLQNLYQRFINIYNYRQLLLLGHWEFRNLKPFI